MSRESFVSGVSRQPVLGNDLVTVRPLHTDDWVPLFAIASDPLLWAVHPAHDRWQAPVFRAFFADALASGGAMVVEDTATGRMVGSSRFDLERCEPGEMEIGWSFLARDVWGGATNAAVKGLMLAHALREVPQVVFMVGETNGRSRRAMEKIGGVLTHREQVAVLAGVPVRHVIYAIDRVGFAMGPLARFA